MAIKAIAISLLVSIGLVGCAKKNEYPPEAVTTFMNACTSASGGDSKRCACVLDKLQAKFSFKEFAGFDMQMQSGTTDPQFAKAMGEVNAECSK